MSNALSVMGTGEVDRLSWENGLDRPHHCAGIWSSSGGTEIFPHCRRPEVAAGLQGKDGASYRGDSLDSERNFTWYFHFAFTELAQEENE